MLLDQVVKAVVADGGEAEKINGTGTYVYNYNFMLGFLAEDNYRYCDILLQPQQLAWIHLTSTKVISPSPTSTGSSTGESPTAETVRAVKSVPDLPISTALLVKPIDAGAKSNRTEFVSDLGTGVNKPPTPHPKPTSIPKKPTPQTGRRGRAAGD